MDHWIVITKQGFQKVWQRNFRSRLFRRWPKPDPYGFVRLDEGRPYAVDPKRFIRERLKPRNRLRLFEREDVYQYWLENEPDPVSFDPELLTSRTGFTGDMIRAYGEGRHIAEILSEGPNWYAIIAILAIVALFGAIAALYFQGRP